MARAIFGTSPKNEKKCNFSNSSKVNFRESPSVFLDRITFPGELSGMPKAFPLIVTGRVTKSVLKMEFYVFLDEKVKKIQKEKQADDAEMFFEILI
jgi:hypothetical protein